MKTYGICATNGVCVGTGDTAAWIALVAVLLFTVGWYVGRRL